MALRTITKEELEFIISEHKNWLESEGGTKAYLRGVDLRKRDLSNVYLLGAILSSADLSNEDLSNRGFKGVSPSSLYCL